ncbi:MAG: S8 family serine peptidase [Proteobacteria bacterium]|nr:S8 family serine peptidase [Pseudomonadota bacterium]
MKRIKFFGLFIFSLFFLVFASVANPEDAQDEPQSRIINVYRKTSNPHTNGIHKLVVPTALEEVESLSIDPIKKQFFLNYKGKEPVKLESVFQPAFPWKLPQESLIQFMSAHTFFLKQFEDGGCKIVMQAPGLGGGGFGKALKSVKEGAKKVFQCKDHKRKGRRGKQQRLKELAKDPKVSSADRGWIKQEQNQIARKSKKTGRNGQLTEHKTIRVPPNKELAHDRGKAAKDGFGYKDSHLQDKDLHKLQHKYEGRGGGGGRGSKGGSYGKFNPKLGFGSSYLPEPWPLLKSSPSTLDLTFPEGPLSPLYESKMVAGKKRSVVDFSQIIRMSKTMSATKDIVYVQVNDVALDPEPLGWALTEETLLELPDGTMPEYPAYVEWVRKTDHANALCHLIADACPQEGFLYHHDVTFDSKDCATGIEEACRNNVHFVNLSVGLLTPISEPFKAALRRAKRQGIGIIVAAGNGNIPFTESPFHKSLAEFAMAEMDGHLLFVTGTQYTFDGKEVKYTDGNMPVFASSITLSAPASQIHVPSTREKGEEVSQGTSLPTAMVTGVAARLKKQYFTMSIKEVFQFLREGARKTYLGLAEFLPPDIFGCGVLDVENTQSLMQKRADLEPVSRAFKHLRSIGNGASDEELAGFLLKDKGWSALGHEEKTKTVAAVVEGKERSDLNEFLSKQNYPLAYRSIRTSGNTASDEELVRFLLESNGYTGWDRLSLASQAWVVTKVIEEAEKSGLKRFLKEKDYPQAYLSIKAPGNTASDEEIVRFLLESNGFKEWDGLPACDKIWVVSKITHEAEGRTLEAFLDLQDYPAALRSIKASGNPSSDAEIVDFLLRTNGYKNLDKLSPGPRGWAVAKIVREEERRALIKFLILKDYPAAYRSIRASGNKASDEEVVKYLLTSNGYKGWEKLSPGTPAWVVGLVLRAAEKQELLEFISKKDYAAAYRSIRASGNKASDEDVIKFLLKSNGFKEWDDLFPDNLEWVINITLRGAERKTLVDILSLKDYPTAYRSIRASGNKASDEDVIKFLLESNGFKVWDSLFPDNQVWVASWIIGEAEGKALEELVNKQDYPAAYRAIKASGNKASDEQIAQYLLTSNGFKGWDKLFPQDQAWAIAVIIGKTL